MTTMMFQSNINLNRLFVKIESELCASLFDWRLPVDGQLSLVYIEIFQGIDFRVILNYLIIEFMICECVRMRMFWGIDRFKTADFVH